MLHTNKHWQQKAPSPIQTITVGFGISPNQPRWGSRALTAGGELHPALKVTFNIKFKKIVA